MQGPQLLEMATGVEPDALNNDMTRAKCPWINGPLQKHRLVA